MGHAMISPSAWAALGLGPVTISARAGASASLGAASHGHHGPSSGLTPVVAPMNPAELNTSAGVAWRGPSKLTLSAELSAATPVGPHGGVARSTVAASVALHLSEGLELALGLALPLAGAPFVAQGQAAFSGRLPTP
jgi:hypothetical protein